MLFASRQDAGLRLADWLQSAGVTADWVLGLPRGARTRGGRTTIVAAPVASPAAVERLAAVADEVRVEHVDPDFEAVGQYYRHFDQTREEEVIALLRADAGGEPHA